MAHSWYGLGQPQTVNRTSRLSYSIFKAFFESNSLPDLVFLAEKAADVSGRICSVLFLSLRLIIPALALTSFPHIIYLFVSRGGNARKLPQASSMIGL
jgi:hypothetical protein